MNWNEICREPRKTIRMNFSISAAPVKVEEVPSMHNFSDDPKSAIIDYELTCFSLLERIRLSKKLPKQILRLRVNEVVRFLRMSNSEKIKEHKALIIQYLNEYIFEIIIKLLSDPKLQIINLIKELGLTSIMRNIKSVKDLQLALMKAKREYKAKDYLSKIIQGKLGETYATFLSEFIKEIENRYLPASKRGVLSENKDVEEQNPLRLAAFSYDSKSESDVLNEVYKVIDSDGSDEGDLYSILDAIPAEGVFKDTLMDDPELTRLLNNYIVNKSEEAKSELKSYLTSTVEFSDVEANNFSLSWDQILKLSRGEDVKDLPDVPSEEASTTQDEVQDSNELGDLDLDQLVPGESYIIDSPEYKVGFSKNESGVTSGIVAMKIGNNFSVKFYKLNKSGDIKNFSSWDKVPFKSITIDSMEKLHS